MNKPTYEAPALARFGPIEAITGTFCIDIKPGNDKGLGYPSDQNWKIIPICQLPDDPHGPHSGM
jgi:hypothetical protein